MLRRALLLAAAACAGCQAIGSHVGYEPVQPIEYSHALHAGEYKIPCAYCHYGADRSRHAGVPASAVCMNCHREVKKDSPEVKKLAEAVASGKPIEWIRVHRFPDFAYFNHARHVTAGVPCQQCHGAVEAMVRVRQEAPLSMGWCIQCHRDANVGKVKLAGNRRAVHAPTDCSGCHY